MKKTHLLFAVLLVTLLSGLAQPARAQTGSTGERERGISLYKEGKTSEAVEVLTRFVTKQPEDYEAWYFLGLALIAKPDIENAIKSFETSLKINPDFALGHVALGSAYLQQNKSYYAIGEANVALKIDPSLADAHYIIGVARLRAGANEEALKHATTALELKPELAPAFVLKSQALLNYPPRISEMNSSESRKELTARYLEAASAIEKFLELSPESTEKPALTTQLESLRFYADLIRTGPNGSVLTAKDATTKPQILEKPEPMYTDDARTKRVTGNVILQATLDGDGTVKHLLVLKGQPFGLTEASLNAARQMKFVPAQLNGQPVSVFIQLEYHFSLY